MRESETYYCHLVRQMESRYGLYDEEPPIYCEHLVRQMESAVSTTRAADSLQSSCPSDGKCGPYDEEPPTYCSHLVRQMESAVPMMRSRRLTAVILSVSWKVRSLP